ncbi:MAG: glycerate kinase [Dehalococcoidia bacterium]|nr:glycerate kinase [Dehalococcoidia bacterium]
MPTTRRRPTGGRPALRVVVAPLEFKGTLTALQAVEAICNGLAESIPESELVRQPMADGGPGTLDVVSAAASLAMRRAQVHDALGRGIAARWGDLGDGAAIIESAQACGLSLLAPHEYDPLRADTRGVGEIILEALDAGARRLFVGLGGSATNDGGRGLLEALGVRITGQGSELSFDLAAIDTRLEHAEIVGLSDVRNSLLGEDGATYVFAPQKGAGDEQLASLEERMAAFADAAEIAFGRAVRSVDGAGAAGGLGFALLLLGGRLLPGAEVLGRLSGIDKALESADALVTGEGTYDEQSMSGKGVGFLVELSRRAHVPAFGFFGRVRRAALEFEDVLSLEDLAGSLAAALAQPHVHLREAARQLGQRIG